VSANLDGQACCSADPGGVAMSRSCDCLTQTDISAVITPKNELPSAPFPFFQEPIS
jgi:hypothetical protein